MSRAKKLLEQIEAICTPMEEVAAIGALAKPVFGLVQAFEDMRRHSQEIGLEIDAFEENKNPLQLQTLKDKRAACEECINKFEEQLQLIAKIAKQPLNREEILRTGGENHEK